MHPPHETYKIFVKRTARVLGDHITREQFKAYLLGWRRSEV